MLLGAVTPTTCVCGWSGDLAFFKREKWKAKCPGGCKRTLCRDGSHARPTKFYGNRRFAGKEARSITKGFHPNEVAFVRKHITAGDINPENGDVSFTDRADERKFNKQFDAMAETLGGMGGAADPKYAGDIAVY